MEFETEIVLDLPFTVQALWGQGSVLFAAGSGAMFRFDGASWQAVPAGDNTINVLGLWGSAPDDVYGVGGNGIILHYDGNALTPMASGTSLNLRGVWGASKSAIFAAGGNAVLRYDGTQWNTLEVGPIDHSYYAVWGSSASDVYVVGRDDNAKKALVRHYDGAQWSDTTIDEDAVLTGVSGNSATDINAVGSAGFAVHFDGATWTKVNTAVPWTLTAIACGAPQGCFAVSSSAVVLQRAPTTP